MTDQLYGYAMWNADERRWDRDLPGHQDASNMFATAEEAQDRLPDLAGVLECTPSDLRVECWGV
jgi:hypothetical protein